MIPCDYLDSPVLLSVSFCDEFSGTGNCYWHGEEVQYRYTGEDEHGTAEAEGPHAVLPVVCFDIIKELAAVGQRVVIVFQCEEPGSKQDPEEGRDDIYAGDDGDDDQWNKPFDGIEDLLYL